MKYKDQLNRSGEIVSVPKRIISLVPSQTELLVDLGLETSIVGLTKFCIHPSSLRKCKTVVGGTKQVNFETITSLKPDIILCNKEENTKEMILELEKIAPVHVSDIYDLEDALKLIDLYGTLFSVEKTASTLIETISKEYLDFQLYIKVQPKLKVVYFIWKNPWMIAAHQTFINNMLELNNFENYFTHLKRYPQIQLDDINEVDVILLSSEPFPFKQEHIESLQLQFPNSKVVLVDGEYFSWYGSRLKDAFRYFKTLRQTL
ncbi:ABC transporter substrate-binding protein [Psychroserpens damuponensis]|uniref:ABC transporter substrate-binding protein n=1 Tax=Psychroserpens damuponensis TaxID=943936 RepID=UPI00058D6FE5|nr:helical backbone metal receptor [Psychroserpens damuponensis]